MVLYNRIRWITILEKKKKCLFANKKKLCKEKSARLERIVIRRYGFLGLLMQLNLTKLLISIIKKKKKKILELSSKCDIRTLRVVSLILGNIYVIPSWISHILEENSKHRQAAALPSFRSIIGVSHVFFIVRLHLARFDGGCNAIETSSRKQRPCSCTEGDCMVLEAMANFDVIWGSIRRWPLQSINPLRSTKKKRKDF